METTTIQSKKGPMNGLAVVGFVALIIIGILTAIYAASFIPKALSRFSSANVYLSNLSATDGTDTTATTPTTPTVATTPEPTVPVSPTQAAPAAPVVTTPTYVTPVYTAPTPTVVRVPAPQTYYSGLPDLSVTITDVGYLRTNSIDSFVSANSVPRGYQGAVRYTVRNEGTNVSGNYRVEIRVSTNGGNDTDSVSGSNLVPNRSVTGTGVFDANSSGTATIRITVDARDDVDESRENNNDDSDSIRLNGSDNSSNDSYDSNGRYCPYGTYHANNRYYCNTSDSGTDSYDSNGTYCRYGTYYSNGRYYCDSSNTTNNSSYDSNGNFCSYGTYYSGSRYYCNTSGSQWYTRDQNCTYGNYYNDGTSYCY
ncbi:MAG: CARDB domain-containing protein [Patescibacteria group bacterium]